MHELEVLPRERRENSNRPMFPQKWLMPNKTRRLATFTKASLIRQNYNKYSNQLTFTCTFTTASRFSRFRVLAECSTSSMPCELRRLDLLCIPAEDSRLLLLVWRSCSLCSWESLCNFWCRIIKASARFKSCSKSSNRVVEILLVKLSEYSLKINAK